MSNPIPNPGQMSNAEDLRILTGPLDQLTDSSTFNSELLRKLAQKRADEVIGGLNSGTDWPRVDLAAIYADGLDPIMPTVVLRQDGKGLLYAGLPNCIFGDPGSGKTAIAQWAAAQEILNGNDVVVIDYETTVRVWLARMRALGVPDADVVARLHYYSVAEGETPPTPPPSATLVVLDSLTGALDATGLDPNNSQDIQAVYRRVIDPYTRAGLAVLVIDHVGHGDKTRPMGSIRKTGIVQGAMYRMEVVAPFGRDRLGQAVLRLHKDNMGGTEAAKKDLVANFSMSATGRGAPVHCTLSVGDDIATLSAMAQSGMSAIEKKKAEILTLLSDEEPRPTTKIAAAVKGNRSTVATAIADLVAEGVLSHQKKGKADLYSITPA